MIRTYRVRAETEERCAALLDRHWEALRRLELVTEDRSLVLRSLHGPLAYVEIFTWVEGGFERAHEHPDVLTIWEAMDPLLEARGVLPKWEFPHFSRVSAGA